MFDLTLHCLFRILREICVSFTFILSNIPYQAGKHKYISEIRAQRRRNQS
jgi:hypothetical protein